MSLRMPHEVVEETTQSLPSESLDLDWLASLIRDAGQPIPIHELARQAVRTLLVEDSRLRIYVAGGHYRRGERVRLLDGRLGDVVAIEDAQNPVQGAFKVISLRLGDGEVIRLAAETAGGPMEAVPQLVSDEVVDQVFAGQQAEMIRSVRRAVASDPRFITLYTSDGEYGCLREFFPPMSPDVLDAALALLLDELFDQVPMSRVTTTASSLNRVRSSQAAPAEVLFTDHHLSGALPNDLEWDDAARDMFETVRSLWARAQSQGTEWRASQMMRVFVQPLLRALGWSVVPMPDFEGDAPGAYALCPDEPAAAGLTMTYESGEPISPWALALTRATRWGQPLDCPSGENEDGAAGSAGRAPDPVPGHQLVGELRSTGARWGVLTNGCVWRLVSRDANSISRTFYEVDLASVFDGLSAADLPEPTRWDMFRRWYMLFGKPSYVTGQDGRCLLERLRERAPVAEQRMRTLLQERLIGEALPAIAGGFATYRRQRIGIEEETAASLQVVKRASFVLLTRLLFTLIAEARNLLPLDNPDYRPHSLTTQARWASDRLKRELPLGNSIYTTPRYDLVLALFHRISRGDPEKGIPCYGRLFYDPAEDEVHAFLEQARLSDASIALALDALTRGLDYRTLDARDLVSACARMLDGQLTVVDTRDDVVTVTVQEEAAAGGGARAVMLPDYVVTSSVEQALAPVLQHRGARFEEAMDRVVALRRELQRALDRQKRAALYAEWEAAAREARETFLGIRVCDPAAGTGSFLIGATDVLTDGMIAAMQGYHAGHPDVPRDWNPIYHLIDEIRRDVGDELARQGGSLDTQQSGDATVLARLVAQRCLFGVTHDAMAAEVAKVGLWLHAFTQGAPLSYLDHRLRWGNPLLGVDVNRLSGDVEGEPFSQTVAGVVSAMYPLTERVDTTPLDVRWSAGQFGKVQETLKPYRLLLDLTVSAALGDADADAALRATDTEEAAPAWIETQAEAEGFFHWALEFPELFIDLAAGEWLNAPQVDVVLGTPPWVETSDDVLTRYYATRFGGEGDATFNVHHAYLALARQLAGSCGGRTAYVLSRDWLATPTGGI